MQVCGVRAVRFPSLVQRNHHGSAHHSCHQCAGQQLVATALFFGIFRSFCWET